jgi:hypothetical protein
VRQLECPVVNLYTNLPGDAFPVVQFDDDLFVSGGWGAEFQRENGPPGEDLGPDEALRVLKAADLHIMNLYVMLSAKFLSTYCF